MSDIIANNLYNNISQNIKDQYFKHNNIIKHIKEIKIKINDLNEFLKQNPANLLIINEKNTLEKILLCYKLELFKQGLIIIDC